MVALLRPIEFEEEHEVKRMQIPSREVKKAFRPWASSTRTRSATSAASTSTSARSEPSTASSFTSAPPATSAASTSTSAQSAASAATVATSARPATSAASTSTSSPPADSTLVDEAIADAARSDREQMEGFRQYFEGQYVEGVDDGGGRRKGFAASTVIDDLLTDVSSKHDVGTDAAMKNEHVLVTSGAHVGVADHSSTPTRTRLATRHLFAIELTDRDFLRLIRRLALTRHRGAHH